MREINPSACSATAHPDPSINDPRPPCARFDVVRYLVSSSHMSKCSRLCVRRRNARGSGNGFSALPGNRDLGEGKGENRTALGWLRNPNAPAVGFDQPARDRQAQARARGAIARACFVPAIEAIEHVWKIDG